MTRSKVTAGEASGALQPHTASDPAVPARVVALPPCGPYDLASKVSLPERAMIERRPTRKVIVGDEAHGFVGIGGDAPVSVQSMTAGYTYEIDKCVGEIHKLAAAGADLVRVAVPEKKDTGRPEGDPPAGVGPDRGRRPLPLPAGPGGDRGRRPQDPPEPRQHQRPGPGDRRHPGVQGEEDPHPHRRQRGEHRRAEGQAEAAQGTGRRLRRRQARPLPGHHGHQAGRVPGHLPRAGLPRHRHQRQEHRPAAGRSRPTRRSASGSTTRCTWA